MATMRTKEVVIVDTVGFYNLPLTECFFVIDTSSSIEYQKSHAVTAWNLPADTFNSVTDVFNLIELVEEHNPPDTYRTIVLCGGNALVVASLLQNCVATDFGESHQRALRAITACTKIVVFNDLKTFKQQFPFQMMEGTEAYPAHDILSTPAKIGDVPLYLGGTAHSDKKAIFDWLGIRCVVNATELVPNTFESVTIGSQGSPPQYLRCAVQDADRQDMSEAFNSSYEFIKTALAANKPVFVHCVEGKSRSASIVINYLLQSRKSPSLSHAVALVKSCRKIASPNNGFLTQLAVVEREIREGVREIESKTSWGSHIDTTIVLPSSAAKVCHKNFKEAYNLEGIFTPDECVQLVQAAEAVGFGYTPYRKQYRGNLRLITMDASLADAVWCRIKHTMPQIVYQTDFKDKKKKTKWEVVGLNACWRISKYYPGDKFGKHVDAAYYENATSQSMFTVNAYMNGGFTNGATRFYQNRKSKDPVFSVIPKPGTACVFRQPPSAAYEHDGEELGSGVKYLFRTDVMYRMIK
eukprot:m.30589 g.30589  ORF g.30589 m.30589 type:complete len:524 (+) comp16311_c1_seq2:130-1701(+)